MRLRRDCVVANMIPVNRGTVKDLAITGVDNRSSYLDPKRTPVTNRSPALCSEQHSSACTDREADSYAYGQVSDRSTNTRPDGDAKPTPSAKNTCLLLADSGLSSSVRLKHGLHFRMY
jgi:hypothetical protein